MKMIKIHLICILMDQSSKNTLQWMLIQIKYHFLAHQHSHFFLGYMIFEASSPF